MTTTTTTTTKKITVALSDAPPVRVSAEDWPVIASADWFSGAIECQANEVARIKVRQHEDGRTLVYGVRNSGPGGQYAGYRGAHAGYLLGRTGEATDEDEIVRHIRRVAGAIDRDDLADECIADLPARDI